VKTLRETQRLETRRVLAEHAIRLFHERGFDETTVDEIASAAGVSPRTFFLHFPTKAAAAFPDHDERVVAFRERLFAGAGGRNPIPNLLTLLLSDVRTHSPMRRARYQLLAKVEALRDEDARTDHDYEGIIADYLMEHWGHDVEARVRSHAIANACMGVIRASLIAWSEDGIDPQQVCFEILNRMLGAPFDNPLQSLQRLQE
jgi:AcrR family transcriptional regulator